MPTFNLDERAELDQPTLIIGHDRDLLHPFSDARANSFFELRFPPNRLSDVICDFLDEVWF